MTYSGTPVSHTDADGSKEGWNATTDGATFVNQPIGSMTGFPNNNTPSDKATYTFTLDVPTTISTITGSGAAAAVSNGVLVSSTPNTPSAGRTTWIWNQTKPMASELSLISIGKYSMFTSTISLAGGGTVPEWSFIDSSISGSNLTTTQASRGQLKNYLDFFEARYGPYPGTSTGLVVDVVPSGINYALETQDRPFFPGVAGTTTTIHEVMHQWFGDNVSPKVWDDIWLNEGPATYAEDQYTNEAGIETTLFSQYTSTGAGSSTWTTPASSPADTDPADLYGSHVYDRGAMALEALRTAISAATFADLMEEWQVRFAGQSPGAAAFYALAEEESGRQLDAFFQDWIFDDNKPVWPGRFNLALATTPVNGPVIPDSTVTYAATVTNTGKVPLTGAVAGAVVTLDLSDVLDNAVVAGSLPANTSLAGSILTWTVPHTAVGATSTLSLPMTVGTGTSGSTLGATAASSTLGSTCTACTSSLAVQDNPVTPSAVPTINDTTPKVGQTLTALPGVWDGAATLAYQWRAAGTPTGTNSATYAVQAADLGKTLTVTVTGSRAGFQDVVQTSLASTAVAPGDQTLTPTPTVSGTPEVGSTLTAVTGTWDAGVTFSYQWRSDDVLIGGATSSTYQPVAADIGKTIKVEVTGSKTAYAPVTKVSNPTAAVAGTLLTQSSTPTPTVFGSARVGETLAATVGLWDPGVTLGYAWLSDGTPVAGATSSTYALVVGDLGRRISVTVTGTRAGYVTVSRTSTQTFPIAKGRFGKPPKPKIKGAAEVGSRLRVVTGAWPAGVRLKIQWYADGKRISGATGKKLLLAQSYRGKRISVKVTGTKPGYRPSKATSARTSAVI